MMANVGLEENNTLATSIILGDQKSETVYCFKCTINNRGLNLVIKWIKAFPLFKGGVAGSLTVIMFLISIWGICLAFSGWKMMVESEIFAILILLLTALAGGQVVKIFKLPPLLGMLLIGLVWRNWNITSIDYGTQISSQWSSIFRNLATVIILLRGGYGLNYTVLKSRWSLILRLSILPCLFESTAIAVGSFFLLATSWLWGFLTGFVLSAASAAVVIPMMLRFQEEGLGLDKGVPTVAIAATSVDNVLAMVAFGILQSFIFSTGTLLQNLGNIPLQIVVGLAFGTGWGLLLRYVPNPSLRNGHVIGGRFFLLISGGVIAQFGAKSLNFSGAGPLACVILAFIANTSWRKQSGWGKPQNPNPIADLLSGVWIFLEAILFGLIGSQIVIQNLNLQLVGYGTLVMLSALVVRFVVSFVSVTTPSYSWRERLFLAVTWVPKATVQAALGPVALETARRLNAGQEFEKMGMDILTLAALSILIAAPIGAIAIEFCGPRLLNKSIPNNDPPDKTNLLQLVPVTAEILERND